jgi:hypothetical protein
LFLGIIWLKNAIFRAKMGNKMHENGVKNGLFVGF